MAAETFHLIIIFGLVVAVFVVFLGEWVAPELVAMGALVVLLISGILDTREVLDVFSNDAPTTIACMFILNAALERTGTIQAMGRLFARAAGHSELRALTALMLIAATVSAFVNNTPVVVVFLPMVLALARNTDLKASRLLIPLSYASIVGGTCTLIGTSTNILVAGVARQSGLAPFGMFEITRLGIIYAFIGTLYMLTIGRKLLPSRETLATLIMPELTREFLTQAIITTNSPLIGRKYVNSPLASMREVRVIDVTRGGERLTIPLNELEFAAGDSLLLKTPAGGIESVKETAGVELQSHVEFGLQQVASRSATLMEGIIGPRSSLIGKTLRDLNFRQRYSVLILAVHRQGVNLRSEFENVRLAFGDTLLVEGPKDGIARLMEERDFLSLTEPTERGLRRAKAPIAIAAIVLVVALAALNVLPIAGLAIIAALIVVLSRCVDPEEAYSAIEWRIIFLIFGMLALGAGMEKTGAARLVATGVTQMLGGFGPGVMLSATYLLAAILTEVISNNAVALLLTPIAIGIAAQLGVDPRPFVIAIMFGSSASFATPIGYQTNTYVYGAGGYRFSDFPRVGVPLNILLWIVASLLIPLFWPFTSVVNK